MNTRPLDSPPMDYYQNYSKTIDGDDANSGNINRIVIDMGKGIASQWLAAAICGICVAVTVGTVWHSKERETETQAQIRVLKNHIDDAYNKLVIIEGRRSEH